MTQQKQLSKNYSQELVKYTEKWTSLRVSVKCLYSSLCSNLSNLKCNYNSTKIWFNHLSTVQQKTSFCLQSVPIDFIKYMNCVAVF